MLFLVNRKILRAKLVQSWGRELIKIIWGYLSIEANFETNKTFKLHLSNQITTMRDSSSLSSRYSLEVSLHHIPLELVKTQLIQDFRIQTKVKKPSKLIKTSQLLTIKILNMAVSNIRAIMLCSFIWLPKRSILIMKRFLKFLLILIVLFQIIFSLDLKSNKDICLFQILKTRNNFLFTQYQFISISNSHK